MNALLGGLGGIPALVKVCRMGGFGYMGTSPVMSVSTLA